MALMMSHAKDADIAARLGNSDGTEAEISGTAALRRRLCRIPTGKQSVAVATGAGMKVREMMSHNALVSSSTEMGVPQVGKDFVLS